MPWLRLHVRLGEGAVSLHSTYLFHGCAELGKMPMTVYTAAGVGVANSVYTAPHHDGCYGLVRPRHHSNANVLVEGAAINKYLRIHTCRLRRSYF